MAAGFDPGVQTPPRLAEVLVASDALRPPGLVVEDLANLAVAVGKRKERHPMLHALLEGAWQELARPYALPDQTQPPYPVNAVDDLGYYELQSLVSWCGKYAYWELRSKSTLRAWLDKAGFVTKPAWVPWALFRETRRLFDETLTKTDACTRYRLAAPDLGRPLATLPNPHGGSAPMCLYRMTHVLRTASKKYGGATGFRRAAERCVAQRRHAALHRLEAQRKRQDSAQRRRLKLQDMLGALGLQMPEQQGEELRACNQYIQSGRPGLSAVVGTLDERRFFRTCTPYAEKLLQLASGSSGAPSNPSALEQAARDAALQDWVAEQRARFASVRHVQAAGHVPQQLLRRIKELWASPPNEPQAQAHDQAQA